MIAPLDGFPAVQKFEGRCAYPNFREFGKNPNGVVAPCPLNLIVLNEQNKYSQCSQYSEKRAV